MDAMFSGVIELMTKACTLGGGAIIAWGLIILAGAMKDKNGVSMDSGIWQIVSGVIIGSAGLLFANLTV